MPNEPEKVRVTLDPATDADTKLPSFLGIAPMMALVVVITLRPAPNFVGITCKLHPM
jgi:hypothetical protein